jgi:hypothetical protein
MDKEHAQFILRSFRPDGADAADPDFAEALQLATADLELASWLATERTYDRTIADAFAAMPVPETLRGEILASLMVTRGDVPQAIDQHDAMMIGAMASIQPPPALRLEVVAAMERSRSSEPSGRWRKFWIPAAAAAGLAFALFATRVSEIESEPLTSDSPVPLEFVQAGFVHTFTTPFFSVDPSPGETAGVPVAELTEKKLPCPKRLPPGLQALKNVGCRELVIDGKRGSLVCFEDLSGGDVHLVIFRREDIRGVLPCQQHPSLVSEGPFDVARWCDDRHVFLLLGTAGIEQLEDLFARPQLDPDEPGVDDPADGCRSSPQTLHPRPRTEAEIWDQRGTARH